MILHTARVEARLEPFEWVWAAENAARIDAFWEERQAGQPSLFDGTVLLSSRSRLVGDTMEATSFEATFFEVRFSRLLAHAEWGFPDRTIRNGFGMGALRGSDGGYLLGVMAAHTANAGRLYFPAGTPDRDDVTPDGKVDIEGNIRREIGEETGFAAHELDIRPGWTILDQDGRLAFMREVVLGLSAAAAQARIRAHIAADPVAELSDIVVIRTLADLEGANVPSFLPVFFADAFMRDRGRRQE